MSTDSSDLSDPRDELHLMGLEQGAGHSTEHGEGNWLVSYADMMTLLVGFFVILLSFSTIDSKKFEALKKAAAIEFGGTYQIPFGDISDRIRAELTKLGLGNEYVIKTSDSGIEISFLGTVFFDSGSAELKPKSKILLQNLIPVIRQQHGDFDVVIEGHTDDVPVSSNQRFRNNWELSSIRACRVLDYFLAGGFSKSRLTAVGFGDARPIVPNLDKDGKPLERNRSQNRRVVIKLLRRETLSAGAAAPTQETRPEQF